jgi:hypothetical protein
MDVAQNERRNHVIFKSQKNGIEFWGSIKGNSRSKFDKVKSCKRIDVSFKNKLDKFNYLLRIIIV